MRKKKIIYTLVYGGNNKKKACGVVRETELNLHEKIIKFKTGKYYHRNQKDRISNWKTKAFERTN